MNGSRLHEVAVLSYPGVALFELSVVIKVFALPRPELTVPWWYDQEAAPVRAR